MYHRFPLFLESLTLFLTQTSRWCLDRVRQQESWAQGPKRRLARLPAWYVPNYLPWVPFSYWVTIWLIRVLPPLRCGIAFEFHHVQRYQCFCVLVCTCLLFQASFVGAMAIADLVKTTLGPKGMDKILQSMVSMYIELKIYIKVSYESDMASFQVLLWCVTHMLLQELLRRIRTHRTEFVHPNMLNNLELTSMYHQHRFSAITFEKIMVYLRNLLSWWKQSIEPADTPVRNLNNICEI